MSEVKKLEDRLINEPHTWLVTGVAGFIGSNLLEILLRLNQKVVGLDNFATGYQKNLDQIQSLVSSQQWANFRFIHGSIEQPDTCSKACEGVEYVLHQAALGSIPRSLADPASTNASNITGFVNMLVASRDAKVKRFVYAASSSTYGDHKALPKVEDTIGNPLSPYAVTKLVNELYANVFSRCYGMECIGLRYFNIFGPRQNPNGAYAAVIPKWVAGLLSGDEIYINGDGETSRDFCFINNAIQANLKAATTQSADAVNQVYNVAVQERTTLNDLFKMIRERLAVSRASVQNVEPIYRDFRSGDMRHSLADISKAKRLLGYEPSHRIGEGLDVAMDWYIENLAEE